MFQNMLQKLFHSKGFEFVLNPALWNPKGFGFCLNPFELSPKGLEFGLNPPLNPL